MLRGKDGLLDDAMEVEAGAGRSSSSIGNGKKRMASSIIIETKILRVLILAIDASVLAALAWDKIENG